MTLSNISYVLAEGCFGFNHTLHDANVMYDLLLSLASFSFNCYICYLLKKYDKLENILKH